MPPKYEARGKKERKKPYIEENNKLSSWIWFINNFSLLRTKIYIQTIYWKDKKFNSFSVTHLLK